MLPPTPHPITLISLHLLLTLLPLPTTAQNAKHADYYSDLPSAISSGIEEHDMGYDIGHDIPTVHQDPDNFRAQATGIDYKQPGRAYAEEPFYGFNPDDDPQDFGTMAAPANPFGTGAATQQEYHCPDDHGVKYRTGGKCYQLLCKTGTNARTAKVIHTIPSMTSLRDCADACAKEPRCAACDLVLPGQRAAAPPNTCVLLANYGDLVGHGNIHYWAPLSMNDCPEPEVPSPSPTSPPDPYTSPYYPPQEYSDDPNCRDPRRGPTIEYKYCYISPSSSSSSASCTAISYGIDPASIARGSSMCARSFDGARPTPIFDQSGEPRCCGPIREYNYGKVVGECPG